MYNNVIMILQLTINVNDSSIYSDLTMVYTKWELVCNLLSHIYFGKLVTEILHFSLLKTSNNTQPRTLSSLWSPLWSPELFSTYRILPLVKVFPRYSTYLFLVVCQSLIENYHLNSSRCFQFWQTVLEFSHILKNEDVLMTDIGIQQSRIYSGLVTSTELIKMRGPTLSTITIMDRKTNLTFLA